MFAATSLWFHIQQPNQNDFWILHCFVLLPLYLYMEMRVQEVKRELCLSPRSLYPEREWITPERLKPGNMQLSKTQIHIPYLIKASSVVHTAKLTFSNFLSC
jgi:hypothetical protein